MKIYNKVVMNIVTGKIIDEDSFEYDGPIISLKGGGTTINSIDEAYNARMATIAEAQQAMAQEYFTFWQSQYKPYEAEMLEANRALIPQETALRSAQLQEGLDILPMQAEATKAQLGGAPGAIRDFYESADVDVGQRMNRAGADVAQEFDKSQGQFQRNLSRMGVMPGSERSLSMQQDFALDRARGVGGARTRAGWQAGEDRFNRLRYAAGFGLGRF